MNSNPIIIPVKVEGEGAVVHLKQQLREAKIELSQLAAQYDLNNSKVVEATRRVAELAGRYDDMNARARAFNPDQKFQGIITFAQGASRAIQGVGGAMAAMGVDADRAAVVTARLQGVMAFTEALGAIPDLKDKFGDMMATMRASKSVIEATDAATKGAAVSTELLSGAVDTTSRSLGGFKMAMAATGIGLLVVGITALIMNWDELTGKIDDNAEATKELNKLNDEAIKSSSKQSASLLVLRAAIEDTNRPMSKRLESIKELKKEFPDQFKNLTDEALLTNKVGDAYNKAADAILRKARASAASKRLEQLAEEELKLTLESDKDIGETNKGLREAKDETKYVTGGSSIGYNSGTSYVVKKKDKQDLIKGQYYNREGERNKKRDSLKKEQGTLLRIIEENDYETDIDDNKKGGTTKTGKSKADEAVDKQKELADKLLKDRLSGYDKEMFEIQKQYEENLKLAKGNAALLVQVEEDKWYKIASIRDKYKILTKIEVDKTGDTRNKYKEQLDEEGNKVQQVEQLKIGAVNSFTQQYSVAKDKQSKKDKDKAKEDEYDLKRKKEQLDAVGSMMDDLTSIAGKNTASGKALSIATATMNTYQGITEVWKAKSVLPEPWNTTSKIAATITTAASGFAAVKGILKTNVPGGGSSGGAVESFEAPQVYGIGGQKVFDFQKGQEQKIYVTEQDISRQQSRSDQIRRASIQGG